MHSEELDNKCRLCVGDIGEDTEKYNINNFWINIYLVEHIEDTPNFARRTELNYSGEKVTVALEKDFKHGANNECKVYGIEAPVEEDPDVPHLQPSPGTFKRKDTSPILTPKSNS